ncbi:hypothetical protein DMH04_49410 [Kibdelosporangium aridum]|uniref:Uncharacterized protein n=1 Tax=Kibdelosporangium aridum TaxID=2030 RepID=A0A428YCU6_KIBAR|nr:hypothetical protein DMH04_49410 [Kibdelosporangium aridum]
MVGVRACGGGTSGKLLNDSCGFIVMARSSPTRPSRSPGRSPGGQHGAQDLGAVINCWVKSLCQVAQSRGLGRVINWVGTECRPGSRRNRMPAVLVAEFGRRARG